MTLTEAETRQREYYQRTAHAYDAVHDEPEHLLALAYVVRYLEWLGATSVLDTGCGTGRALRYLHQQLPDLKLRGNDPSEAMLAIAAQHGMPGEWLDAAESERLPYANESFDAVIAIGVMHHVQNPEAIVREMIRVARLGVFVSDSNIYGQGSLPARLIKLGLARSGLLKPFNWARRGGRLWYESEGDGVAYSYSAFDSWPVLAEGCDHVLAIPTGGDRHAGRSPILHARHVLVCGFKVPLPV